MSRPAGGGIDPSGLYDKYRVWRIDGQDGPGCRHEGCWYLVLDPAHDPIAWACVALYAQLIGVSRPQLGLDLREALRDLALSETGDES